MATIRKNNATLALLLSSVALGLCLGGMAAWGGTVAHVVSQQGREFRPGEIAIARGETLMIVNDDGDLLHHAYVDAPDFSFDSGDQEPGARTPVTFTKTGTFTMLCAIHPKMKMVVHVAE